MSGDRYYVTDQHAIYFLTFTVVDWNTIYKNKVLKIPFLAMSYRFTVCFLSCSIMLSVVLSSCTQSKLEARLNKYAKDNDCKVEGCLFKMRDITWFDWDRMIFSEGEEGLSCSFLKGGRIVYKYLKPRTFDGPMDIEFGFADQFLNEAYTHDNCTFKLKVEERDDLFRSNVYFILPAE